MRISTKHGYTIMELLVTLLLLGIVAAVLFPIFARRPGIGRRSFCQSNLRNLGLAMIQYTQDSDEKFPPLAIYSTHDPFAKPYGWADVIQPYAKSTQILQCPSEANREAVEDATQSGFTDYWFNTNLNARLLKDIKEPAWTFLLGEGNDGVEVTDARYNRNVVPKRWIEDAHSPARRHNGGGSYLFADGHVKAFAPAQMEQVRYFVVK